MRIINPSLKKWNYSGALWIISFALLLFIPPKISAQNNSSFSEYSAEIPGSDQAIEMIPVPGGTFEMGPINNNVHEISVDSFWIGKYEITWNEYNQFRNEVLENLEPKLTANFTEDAAAADIISLPSPPYVDMSFGMGTDGFPAAGMTHYAAFMFTKWLSEKTGDFYRLPTEAEWEYACRAANPDKYQTITNESELNQYAWHKGNSDRKYHKPGMKQPNALGIHDMLGNVAEWTFDQYHEDYISQLENEPAENPYFKPTVLYPRTARGGSWMDGAEAASCLQRRGSNPQWKMRDPQLPKSLWWLTNASFLGFRVVKPVNQPESTEEMEKYWIDAMQDYF